MWKLSISGPRAATREPKRWIVDRYFGKFNKFRNDRWVFGDARQRRLLVKFSWTAIVRHAMVKGAASPDDPALAGYWAERRKKVKPPLDSYTLRLLTRQDGTARCAGTPCLTPTSHPSPPGVGTMVAACHPQGDSRQLPHPPRAARPPDDDQTRLVHAPASASCKPASAGNRTAASTRDALAACLSRVPG